MMRMERRRWIRQHELAASRLRLIRASGHCHHLELLQRTTSDHPGSAQSAFLVISFSLKNVGEILERLPNRTATLTLLLTLTLTHPYLVAVRYGSLAEIFV